MFQISSLMKLTVGHKDNGQEEKSNDFRHF